MIIVDRVVLHEISMPLPAEEQTAVFEALEAEIRKHSTAVGLSAPQIGVQRRAFVYYTQSDTDPVGRTLVRVANPMILGGPQSMQDSVEGCLSVPDVQCLVRRYSEILAQDDLGGRYVLTGDDAVVFQHEMDHLDGVLITDVGMVIPKDIGRNDPCYCGSGKKYKVCHWRTIDVNLG